MIELTTAIVLLVSSLYGGTNVAVAQDIANNDNTQSLKAIEEPITLQAYVQNYFAETPILAEIARCESGFRQLNNQGQVLRGEVNKSDLGLLQVNEYYHGKKASDLGFDLTTVNGNLDYAKYLYDKEGTRPWNASAKCWKK
ncbi:MAG: hypothetical protein A2541_00295 [Candidatus Taylorbacteria bacterium RIFOXYD2_FULL_36_9]|uniref:Transglycosylase SLT domain-containing protein n=1 Tax=Candidatus Taylorbacteria bacterium RIFOXYD2_FULL_36_9 TaxID=1802338 RepID=A0A1G2PDW3_9BACT|nr:MAG: hypothetical protein A2541_00295 [Candidatus Taylorbacteria bacterium RIFOXYD2_FULL_36_9]